MGSPSIDYMALAKQAGAVSSTPAPKKIDYNALAKQAGAVSSTPAPASVAPGGIDPSKVAGAGPLGLPGMPAAPNPVKQKIAQDDAVMDKYNAGTLPVDQFKEQAAQDIQGGLKSARDSVKDWWNNSAAQKVIQPVAAAGRGLVDSVVAPFSAVSEATGLDSLAGQAAQPINEASDQAMGMGGMTPPPPTWQPHPVAAAQRMFGGNPEKADELEAQGNTGGAAWERWGKPVANYLAMEAGARGLRAGYDALMPLEGPRANDAFANLIAGGVKSGTPQETAVIARPVWQQAAHDLGLKDEGTWKKAFTGDTPTRNLPGQKGPIRNTVQGTEKILQVADRAVEIADKPMDAVMKVAQGDVVDPQVRAGIVQGMLTKAAESSSVGNEATAKAYMQLAEKVKQQRTYGDLNNLKRNANNQIERMGAAGTVSQQIAQATTPIAAWEDLGGLIREKMYPVLQDRYIPKPGQTGYFDLADMGRRERAVIDARDGAYKAQQLAATQDAAAGAKTASEKATEGSMYKTHIARRLLGVNPTPAGQVNKMFRRGLGEIGTGGAPESVSTVPVTQPLALPPPPGYGEFSVPTAPSVEGAPGAPVPMAQSYRGTIQVPNPDHTPLSGPSHFQQRQELGTTATTIPDRVRGAQSPARVEADQLGTGHPTPPASGVPSSNPRGLNVPTRSLTGPETLTKANFEQHFGTNAAPAVDRGTAGLLRTNDPPVATRALKAMDDYMKADEFKGLDAQTRYTAKQQAADLRRQLVQHAAVKNMPGPVQYQVHWTPADMGKKAGRKVGLTRRGAAYTLLVPPGKKKDAAAAPDENETPEQEEERMRGPGDAQPAAPRKIRARDENGVLHEADAGTPLPPGWRVESGT
jgi:hypothetical protein